MMKRVNIKNNKSFISHHMFYISHVHTYIYIYIFYCSKYTYVSYNIIYLSKVTYISHKNLYIHSSFLETFILHLYFYWEIKTV